VSDDCRSPPRGSPPPGPARLRAGLRRYPARPPPGRGCASENANEGVMMPHTVPNKPTNGAVALIVASTAGAARQSAATSRPRHDPAAAQYALEAVIEDATGETGFPRGGSDDLRDRVAAATACTLGSATRYLAQAGPVPACMRSCGEVDGLCQPDGPCHQRGERQPEHDRFHHDSHSRTCPMATGCAQSTWSLASKARSRKLRHAQGTHAFTFRQRRIFVRSWLMHGLSRRQGSDV